MNYFLILTYTSINCATVVPTVMVETVEHETPGTEKSKGKTNTGVNESKKSKRST